MTDIAIDDLAQRMEGDVFTDPERTETYFTDWRGKWIGEGLAVARPRSAHDVGMVVQWCHERKIPIVPQGGNTGLSGAATPDRSGRAMVVSLERMNTIHEINSASGIISADAGCTLVQLQEAAAEKGRLFPLSFASEGTCQIGGALSTNAGGTHVFRYGTARDLCVGVEVVLPNGEILSEDKSLFKDNTGYSLRNLFIGAEGTLGIITGATLRTYPEVKAATAIFVSVPSIKDACETFLFAQSFLGPELTSCEVISDVCLAHVLAHNPNTRFPLQERSPYYVLLEVSSWDDSEACQSRALAWFEAALEAETVLDAVLSDSVAQFRDLWALRERISESQSHQRPIIKHDISLPLNKIAQFVGAAQEALSSKFDGLSIEPFGHLGDGNLHYNIGPAEGADVDAFAELDDPVNLVVHDIVNDLGGSISAEHGLGVLRRDEAERYRSPIASDLMRSIKATLDPLGLMNPGKVLTSGS